MAVLFEDTRFRCRIFRGRQVRSVLGDLQGGAMKFHSKFSGNLSMEFLDDSSIERQNKFWVSQGASVCVCTYIELHMHIPRAFCILETLAMFLLPRDGTCDCVHRQVSSQTHNPNP